MKKCPFFGKCGGCKFDFTADDYYDKKQESLRDIPTTSNPIWIDSGARRRADFAFFGNQFGFYRSGSKQIVPISNCPLLVHEINQILPALSKLPFIGAGSVLITSCDNGIDASIISSISYFSSEFKSLAEKLPAIRISWNGKAIKQSEQPIIKFEDKIINYPVDAFLQPSIAGEKTLRGLVRKYTAGSSKIVDLFSGLGNFTFAVNAIGYDINGLGSKRDLFKKPLKPTDLNKYDCVIMDPPRGGATAQCKELIKSNIHRIVYVSCSPDTFTKDKNILESGGFKLINLIPVDQFVGSDNWELVSLFTKD